ncbi:Flagellar basal-body rod protein FlgG [Caloramator mitchellensis]|uniref:Flagellar basal-body rod protein FlgG n=1 Tax=Caloramator mitchellensis TaxID=908809 RepID=A0A0R3JXF8_CALMK|nr:flagellar hook-basal body complex protein [Caloramator mitchellensis]KRQ87037.1 Flagellar basal-body rod protein FlgG [Caloramator mitchellensis]
MLRGIYTAASGMITKQVQLENLSNNVSNINTAGYKKQKVSLKSFEELVLMNKDKQVGDKSFPRRIGTIELGVGIDGTRTNFSQGDLEKTDRILDFAINGDGFFTVEDENGSKKYTRDGRFKIDSEGNLIATNGYKVIGLDENGYEKTIKVNSENITLNPDGTISGTDNLKFLITTFEDKNQLLRDANDFYNSKADGNPVATDIKQGFVEKSNVDTIEVITEMMSIMRSYESSQKVMQSLDETLSKTVNEVGNVR